MGCLAIANNFSHPELKFGMGKDMSLQVRKKVRT